jgi:hypothetical protein
MTWPAHASTDRPGAGRRRCRADRDVRRDQRYQLLWARRTLEELADELIEEFGQVPWFR